MSLIGLPFSFFSAALPHLIEHYWAIPYEQTPPSAPSLFRFSSFPLFLEDSSQFPGTTKTTRFYLINCLKIFCTAFISVTVVEWHDGDIFHSYFQPPSFYNLVIYAPLPTDILSLRQRRQRLIIFKELKPITLSWNGVYESHKSLNRIITRACHHTLSISKKGLETSFQNFLVPWLLSWSTPKASYIDLYGDLSCSVNDTM